MDYHCSEQREIELALAGSKGRQFQENYHISAFTSPYWNIHILWTHTLLFATRFVILGKNKLGLRWTYLHLREKWKQLRLQPQSHDISLFHPPFFNLWVNDGLYSVGACFLLSEPLKPECRNQWICKILGVVEQHRHKACTLWVNEGHICAINPHLLCVIDLQNCDKHLLK